MNGATLKLRGNLKGPMGISLHPEEHFPKILNILIFFAFLNVWLSHSQFMILMAMAVALIL